jgi:hypothetical protein
MSMSSSQYKLRFAAIRRQQGSFLLRSGVLSSMWFITDLFFGVKGTEHRRIAAQRDILIRDLLPRQLGTKS